MVSHHFFFRHMFRPLDLKDQKSLRQKNSKVPKLPNPEFSKESDLCRRRKVATTVICLSPCKGYMYPTRDILPVQGTNHPSQQHKICVITQMSPSYCKTIKTLISSILLAQLVLMHGRYKFPTLFYSKYSILHLK